MPPTHTTHKCILPQILALCCPLASSRQELTIPRLRPLTCASMTDIPIKKGLSPNRWHMVIDVVTLVEELRTILIFYQAGCTYMNTYIRLWNEMIKNAKKYGQLAQEQYGSWNSLNFIIQAINNRFTLNIAKPKWFTLVPMISSPIITTCLTQ
jgi:hypothetical protein